MKKSIGLLLAVSVVAVGLYASIASASTQSTKAVLVTVTMTDYHFKLSKTTGYKRGVAYTFKVQAKNAVGNSPMSVASPAHSGTPSR